MAISIVRAQAKQSNDLIALLNEYYEALNIQKRDTSADTKKYLEASALPESGIGYWLAYENDTAIGCILFRMLGEEEHALAKLSAKESAGEVKRLFIRESHRGRRIADLLVDKLETFAIVSGVDWMYLDSKDDLHAALKLYKRRGYVACDQYNINPQATVFLRKRLARS